MAAPTGGQSPIEWGEIPYVHPFAVHSRGLRASQRGDVRTDVRTDGISPHSTGLRPLSGPLPKKQGGSGIFLGGHSMSPWCPHGK